MNLSNSINHEGARAGGAGGRESDRFGVSTVVL
jgi:hypothetical protein